MSSGLQPKLLGVFFNSMSWGGAPVILRNETPVPADKLDFIHMKSVDEYLLDYFLKAVVLMRIWWTGWLLVQEDDECYFIPR